MPTVKIAITFPYQHPVKSTSYRTSGESFYTTNFRDTTHHIPDSIGTFIYQIFEFNKIILFLSIPSQQPERYDPMDTQRMVWPKVTEVLCPLAPVSIATHVDSLIDRKCNRYMPQRER